MALIKSTTLLTQESGDYWRLLEVNDHAERGSVATLQLYKSKTARLEDAQPLSMSLQFVFSLDEVEDAVPDENLPEGWRDVWYHVHYLLIKTAAESGHAKPTEERTQNEQLAQVIYGATDDF